MEDAERETAFDEAWVRILENKVRNHTRLELETRTVHGMISGLVRPVLRLGSGRSMEWGHPTNYAQQTTLCRDKRRRGQQLRMTHRVKERVYQDVI